MSAFTLLPDDWSDLLQQSRANGYEIGCQSPEGAPPTGVRYWPISKHGYAAGPMRTHASVDALRQWLARGCMDGYAENEIATGDAFELAQSIPDNSVDLV